MLIHIQTHGLNFRVHLTPTDDDWLTCDLEVTVPGFTGAYSANLQIGDLIRFLGELQEMYSRPGGIKKAVLQGNEPGIFIELTSSKTGAISGEYEFNNYLNDNKLVGSFFMDLSYLPSIILNMKSVLQKVR